MKEKHGDYMKLKETELEVLHSVADQLSHMHVAPRTQGGMHHDL